MRGAKGRKNPVRGKGRIPRRRPAARRSKYEVREQASLTEVISPQTTLNANQNYSSYTLNLASLPRASLVAKGFQYFRIKRITYVIKPFADTFAPGALANVPYLYYMIDRTKQFVNGFTTENLRNMGAKARRVDDKTITFSYTPSVLTETFDDSGVVPVQYKLMPWLPTRDMTSLPGVWTPSIVDHLGVVWTVEQLLATSPVGYTIERRIQVEFKKPQVPTFPPGENLAAQNIVDINDVKPHQV